MNLKTKLTSVYLLCGLLCMVILSCSRESLEGKIIIAEVPGTLAERNLVSGENWRYPNGARLVAVDPVNPASNEVLTTDYYSASSPMVSNDGKFMVFAAQQKQSETWQIWEMDLAKRKCRKITDLPADCTDPVLLPNDRVVFTSLAKAGSSVAFHALFSCKADGSDLKQITFHPHANFATSILSDGRLLTISRSLIPEQAGPMIMVLRPDGTKADLFYKNTSGSSILSRTSESPDGDLFFIEADSASPNLGSVTCIRYNRPLHSRINLSQGIEGDFNALGLGASGSLLVSYRPSVEESFSLYEFDIAGKALGKKVYSSSGYNVTDVAWVQVQDKPKKLPSEVDMEVKTGLLMCQDINVTGLSLPGSDFLGKRAVKIEILGIDSTLGIVHVEPDGSFYLKVNADMPFRIQTLDEKGNVIQGPCDWIWIRPNERRGCVGCHEDPELAPENLVPMAVKKDPVTVPVHISGISEKEVELE
jgi:hypothetical protein